MGKELAQERKVDGSVKKLLFLGSGGSGKSTLFKQLRSLHGAGFGDKDRLQFKEHIYAQITEQMRLVIECIEVWNEDAEEKTLELTAAGEEAKAKLMGHANATQVSIHSLSLCLSIHTSHIRNGRGLPTLYMPSQLLPLYFSVMMSAVSMCTQFNAAMAEVIKTLWVETAVKQIYDQRALMKIEDSSAYFWDEVDRVVDENFIPNDRDILLVRYRTTGLCP